MAQKVTFLETTVPGREGEGPTRLRLNTPGQRGVLQSLVEIKKSASKLLPKYQAVQTVTKRVNLKQNPVTTQTRRLNKYLTKSKRYLDKIQLLTTDDEAKRTKLLGTLARALQIALNANQVLQNSSESLQELSSSMKLAVGKTNELGREFQQELKRVETVAESWLDLKWSSDNSTAVGRGPPGHITYNPFGQYTLPYDTNDVKRVIEDANRRVR